ncbi:MAG: hypothetical protein OXF79_12415 [Chloroflexi bacterium]|nr:hypothetical protein [Chloroflexota bacterium]
MASAWALVEGLRNCGRAMVLKVDYAGMTLHVRVAETEGRDA